MEIRGLSHLTFSVSDLERSVSFYGRVFGAQLLVRSKKTAYFDPGGLWIALNWEADIPRCDIQYSYTHIAFTIAADDLPRWRERLREAGIGYNSGWMRRTEEGESIYFADPDGHKFEMHTGTRDERIDYCREHSPGYIFSTDSRL